MIAETDTTTTPADAQVEQAVQEVGAVGYTIVRGAIGPDRLPAVQAAWHRLVRDAGIDPDGPGHHRVDGLVEFDPALGDLMDLPTTLPIVSRIIGRDVTLAYSGSADYMAPDTDAYIGWHNDFIWFENVPYPRQMFLARCTFLVEDVGPDQAPMTLLPATHRADRPCPGALNQSNGKPRQVAGQVPFTGKAGDCLINNTELWHTNTPNRSDRARKMIFLTYKHSWMRQMDSARISDAFASQQTDPVRQQLCEVGTWFRPKRDWAL